MFTEAYGYWTKHDVQTKEQFIETLRIGEWERFKRAMREFKTEWKAVTRVNVMSCCSGCAEIKSAEGQTVIWHFGGQGNRVAGDFDASRIYLNHDNLDTDQFKSLFNKLWEAGIELKWEDYSASRALEVCFKNDTALKDYAKKIINAKKVLFELEWERKQEEAAQAKAIADANAWLNESAWV